MANIITLSRIILTFIVMALLYYKSVPTYIAAFILSGIVIWFDGLDGYLARKLNEASRIGAMLDILGDRIVECSYWVVFACLGWIPVFIPIIVLARGFLTDGVRSLAFEKGYTAFGSTTMMKTKLGKFLVASNFSRGTYAVAKAFAFVLLIVAYIPTVFPYQDLIYKVAMACVYISVVFCVLRGLPVLIEGARFLTDNEEK